MKPDISKMGEQEVINLLINTMIEYVDRFEEEVTKRCMGYKYGCGIEARFSTHDYGDYGKGFYMDYSATRPTYTKATAKQALELFKEYANIITLYLDVLKFKYPEIEYTIDKTAVSSARIGKELSVSNFPFALPDMYYQHYLDRNNT